MVVAACCGCPSSIMAWDRGAKGGQSFPTCTHGEIGETKLVTQYDRNFRPGRTKTKSQAAALTTDPADVTSSILGGGGGAGRGEIVLWFLFRPCEAVHCDTVCEAVHEAVACNPGYTT